MYAIGLDIGTTSVCGILHSVKTGEVVRSCTLANDSFLNTPHAWEKLQDPKRLLEILCSIADTLLAQGKDVVSIGVTGQMHGIVYLNSEGEPVSPLKIWQDGRGDREYRQGKTYVEFMSEQTGYSLATGYGAVTYFYDAKNGIVPEEAVTFCTIHDLAAMTLAGKKRPLLHPSDAASLGLFDLKAGRYDTEAIRALGLDDTMFPAVCSGFEVLGDYRGIPVAAAIGDNQASFLGSVADMEHSLLVNVGTGSQISCLTHTVPDANAIDCRPLLDGSFLLAGSSLCGGRAYAMLEKFFREVASAVTGGEVASAYAAMDAIMASFDDDAAPPLEVTTTFSGTRHDPETRGAISNIGIDNLNMASFCDGFMRGMTAELYGMFLQIKPFLSDNKTVMVGSGNGVRHNAALRQRFERLFGLPMVIPSHKEEAAFGASLYALTAAGVFENISQAQKLIRY